MKQRKHNKHIWHKQKRQPKQISMPGNREVARRTYKATQPNTTPANDKQGINKTNKTNTPKQTTQ